MEHDVKLPLVYVSIVTWNGQKWIKNCLDSVLATSYPAFKVVVVDNASTDETCTIIDHSYPQVELIRNKKNAGYGVGHNIGIRCALKHEAEYIVLLNQDLTVDPKWLSVLVNVAETDERFGILTPFQYQYDGVTIDSHFLSRMLLYSLDFKNDYDSNKPLQEVYEHDCSFGTAMFVKKEVFLKVGLFDPFYFMYHEEGDLLQRCFFHGYRMALVTSSKVNHWHTALHPENVPFKIRFYTWRNTFISILKDPQTAFIKNIIACFIQTMKMIVKNVRSIKGFVKIGWVLCILFLVIILIPFIFYKRFREKRVACYL